MAVVMKFGGTSVGSAQRIQVVYEIVKSKRSLTPIVVVSAVGGITDQLIALAKQSVHLTSDVSSILEKHERILSELHLPMTLLNSEFEELTKVLETIHAQKELTKKLLDHVVSFGERMSARIVAAYFTTQGLCAQAYDAYDIGMLTDSNFTDANVKELTYIQIQQHPAWREKEIIPIITGFIAKNEKGEITTLGRGGSDYTAAIVGAALHVSEIQIWTDVNGIMTSDPRIVKNAKSIDTISFVEASELAYFGAKVLHPKTILPAMKKDIPVVVLNTYEPSHPGTRIVRKGEITEAVVKAISSKKNITVLRVVSSRMLDAYGFLAKIFNVFEKYGIVVDMIATSEISVSITIDRTDCLNTLIEELEQLGNVEYHDQRAIICIVGKQMKSDLGLVGKIFTICGQEQVNVEMISQGASQVNTSFIVKNSEADRIVNALHRTLIESHE